VLTAETSQGNLVQESVLVLFDDHPRHARGEPSRRNSINLDVVNPPLASQVLGEGNDAAFAGVIPDGLEFRRRPANARHRGDVNNLSAALRDHELSDGL